MDRARYEGFRYFGATRRTSTVSPTITSRWPRSSCRSSSADSHCTTLLSYAGSEIQEAGIGLQDYITALLDPAAPLESYLESVQPGEDED